MTYEQTIDVIQRCATFETEAHEEQILLAVRAYGERRWSEGYSDGSANTAIIYDRLLKPTAQHEENKPCA